MSADEGGRENRLAGETSPYLLLHRHNPVDWYPWGEEALARARDEDKPIFLSVGYSTCYWCHVMERESFSDEEIAAVMNREFVNIKLDREERPELDEIYMAATQLLTHQGGWPNSVFLTPRLEPYFAGTYFPPAARHGLPSFRQVIDSMASAWHERRDDVEEQAQELAGVMRRYLEERGAPGAEPPGGDAAERSLESLRGRFDAENGGFGGAPKFPSPANLFLLDDLADEAQAAARMLAVTLDKMARGGLYDQLGGGFHRYATDAAWKVPHFEKMLYDNGQLIELYARHHARSGDPEARRIVVETAAFLAREMTSDDGALWSAIDAETHGREGAFYVWTVDQLAAALDGEEASFLAPIYGYDGPPFFEGEHYVLHLPEPLAEQAGRRRIRREELLAQIEPSRARLMAARDERQRPLTDDKVLTDWNGMAIAGLAEAGRLLDDAGLVEQARRAAACVLDRLRPAEGPLQHCWRAGEPRVDAMLADYVFLVRGLLALYRATDDGDWLVVAEELTMEQHDRLADPAGGFYAAGEAADVLFRSKEIFDGALPATNAVAVLNLVELARVGSDVERWRSSAERSLRAFAGTAERQLDAARTLALAARRYARAFGAEADEGEVVTVDLRLDPAGDDGWRRFELRLDLADGWHLYAHDAAADLVQATVVEGEGAELRGVGYPEGQPGADGMATYAGEASITGELRVTAPPAQLRVAYQPCDDRRCLAPAEKVLEIDG